MNLEKRIESFQLLGDHLCRYREGSNDPELISLVTASRIASVENQWFTPGNIEKALNSLGEALNDDNLSRWLSGYYDKLTQQLNQKTIGVVMAGNIPAVGFHDFLCVLISGHKLKAKLSSSDLRLIPSMAEILVNHMPEWQDVITFTTGRLDQFDAIIATGNDNTSRYFEYYFGKYPHIIRKNRNSIAVITGNESQEMLGNLADDIMLFFGMGCRSVTKVFVPTGYDFSLLINALGKYGQFVNHNKFRNNYDYCKSIFMVNQVPVIDTGCLLLKEDTSIKSRIAVLNYEYYSSISDVMDFLKDNETAIQCVVSSVPVPVSHVLPGNAQQPLLSDYADGINTLDFLLS